MNRIWLGAGVGVIAMLLVAFSAAAAEKAKLTVESEKIKANEPIPAEYTADGKDTSPPLSWKGAPEGTKQFALIMDDPDAPTPKPWVHWVVYNIPASVTKLPEGIAADAEIKEPKELAGAIQGLTGWRKPGYRGPAPPKGSGVHHYTFKVYALDTGLELKPGLNKDDLLKAIEGHVIGEGELAGTYER